MSWIKGHKLQDGKYSIEKKLDEGGFGITYLVKRGDGKKFVVKILNDDVQKGADFTRYQQNFVNEALRLAKCHHPHIVSVEELIQEGELWGMVMEYIEGETLASLVEREGILPESQALRYIRQIGEALAVVHQNGLLHRDVKPQNIMLRSRIDEAVLIDFGLAREFEQDKTQAHTQFLSHYFAPIEQYNKRAKRGAYTDVYALAGTLYFLMTAEYPVPIPNRVTGTDLDLPSEYNLDIEDWLENAILKGLEIQPDDRPQSIQEWLDLLVIDPELARYKECLNLAKKLEENSKYEEALKLYDEAIQINSDSYVIWYRRGIALWILDENEEAVKSFDHAIKINSDSCVVWQFRGCALRDVGQDEEAVESYDQALRIDSNQYQIWFDRGITLWKLGQEEEAINSYSKALEINPDKDEIRLKRGLALWLLDRNEVAISDLDQVLKIDSQNHRAWHYRGRAMSDMKEYEQAIESYDKALGIDANYYKAWHHRGVALEELNKREEAIFSYKKAVSLSPNYSESWSKLGGALWMLDNNEEAVAAYDCALEINPNDYESWFYRGKALTDLGRDEDAISSYTQSLQIQPNYVLAWKEKANLLYDCGKGCDLYIIQLGEERKAILI